MRNGILVLALICAASLATTNLAAQQIYDNGPLSTGPTLSGGGTAPMGYEWSEMDAANITLGFGGSVTSGQRLGDDFTVPSGQQWTVNSVVVFAYQTNYVGGTSPITAGTLRIWSGNPGSGGSVVAGDTTTDVLTASTQAFIYRVANNSNGTTREVWSVTLTLGSPVVLNPGSYWVDWQTTSVGGSHFAPPVTLVGQTGKAGANAMALSGTTWSGVTDGGSGAAQDFPFKLNGSTSTLSAAEIDIVGPNTNSIASGGSYTHATPILGGSAGPTLTFTIANQGGTDLTITSASLTGTPTNCSPSINTSPTSPVAGGSSTSLGISVNPSAGIGTWSFQFTVVNSDSDEGTYVVNVQGVRGLSGTYTVLSAGGGDYSDIGAAFDDMESFGLAGAVLFEVTGTFTSSASYELGRDGTVAQPVTGISATNTITFRGVGGRPVISGAGATDPYGIGSASGAANTMVIMAAYVTLENLEFTGGVNGGVLVVHHDGVHPTNNFSMVRCAVHDISAGPGLAFLNGTGPVLATNGLVRNNMFWACGGAGVYSGFTNGAISFHNIGSGFVVDHNTILHNTGTASSSAIHFNTPFAVAGSSPVDTFTNNAIVNSTNATPCIREGGAGGGASDPNTCDYNCYFFTGGATFHTNTATYPDFVAWQTAGNDVNGLNTDPLLVNTSAGTEDLHLQSSSPVIDQADPASANNVDFDGDTRPVGSANDIGADEGQFPEMDVLRGANAIADGGTDTVNISGAGTNLTYTIENNGAAQLNLNGATIVVLTPGTNVTSVTLTTPPTTPVAAGGNTTFVVNVVPTTSSLAGDPYSFTVSIDNDDSNENPYNFTVSGNALSNQPAQADLTTGSSLTGGTNGPFSISVNPGAALANVSIDLTDPEADNITVASITPPGTVPTGITPPSIPTPGQPLTLSWTGTADASNAPGAYLWVVTFADAVNGTNVVVNVTITINDVAPTHTAASGISGDGSVGTPYLTTYAENDPASLSVNLANVSDANTGQNLNLSTPIQTGGPTGGSGFTFSLVGGVLSVAPSATLVAADVGTQVFSMDVDDGPNTVTIYVSITVLGNSGAISITNASPLPAGTVGAVYTTVTLTATGGTAPYTYTVISGALPAGLSLSLAGDITGTPTLAGTANFTVRATDSLNDSGTKAFTLTVNAPATGSGGGGGGGGGCSTDGEMPYSWLLLLGLLSLTALVVRTRKA